MDAQFTLEDEVVLKTRGQLREKFFEIFEMLRTDHFSNLSPSQPPPSVLSVIIE